MHSLVCGFVYLQAHSASDTVVAFRRGEIRAFVESARFERQRFKPCSLKRRTRFTRNVRTVEQFGRAIAVSDYIPHSAASAEDYAGIVGFAYFQPDSLVATRKAEELAFGRFALAIRF